VEESGGVTSHASLAEEINPKKHSRLVGAAAGKALKW
jgi:hypothetical protein